MGTYKLGRNAYQKMYYLRTKVLALEHYGNGKIACVRCGFSDLRALSIDYVNGNGNQLVKGTRLSGMPIYYWLKEHHYPEGFQILCVNCQWIKKN